MPSANALYPKSFNKPSSIVTTVSYDNFKEYVAAKKRLVRLSEKVVASKELARKLKIEVNYNEYIDVKDVKSFDYNLVLNVLKCLGLETDKIDFDFNKINIECRNELFLFDGDISFHLTLQVFFSLQHIL